MLYRFDLEHARRYGVDEAVMIYGFQVWIRHNRSRGRHSYRGRHWTYNSAEGLTGIFPCWTRRQVQRIVASLVRQQVLVTASGLDGDARNGTLWYAFVDEAEFLPDEFPAPSAAAQAGPAGSEAVPEVEPPAAPDRAAPAPNGAAPAPNRAAPAPDRAAPAPNGAAPYMQYSTKNQLSGSTRSDAAPARASPAASRELRSRAHRLYEAHRTVWERYFQGAVPRAARQDLIECLEVHLGAGRAITSEQIETAVRGAQEFWRRGAVHGAPRTAGPVVVQLNGTIHPLAKETPDDDAHRSHRRSGDRSREADRPGRTAEPQPAGTPDPELWRRWLPAAPTDAGAGSDR